jgi:hypothetical protein
VLPLGCLKHADVARLDDGGRPRREIREKRPLLDELVEEPLPVLLREIAERLEHLERHRPLPDDVHRAVNRREAAFADEGLDGVLVRNRAADEL